MKWEEEPHTWSQIEARQSEVEQKRFQCKEKAPQLGLTSKEYARSTLNLLNPRTPEKRVTILQQQQSHPCWSLFQQTEPQQLDVESELGNEATTKMSMGQSLSRTSPKPSTTK
ncbi:hypothetical protein RRG08_022795 [Elysia crispata]|uniref:Uncharacterized protein n=1 Tax=Elysia crispata TaxID=231223 RepID=A0AAE0Z0V2_9GAST|nr:hypothetical protein RRG08_022795 [Elysia crispata]